MKTIALSTLALLAGISAANAQVFILGGDSLSTGQPAARTLHASPRAVAPSTTFGLAVGPRRTAPADAFAHDPSNEGIARRSYTK